MTINKYGRNFLNKKVVFIVIFIIVGFIVCIRLRYDNINLSYEENEFDKTEALIVNQSEIDKSEILHQVLAKSLISKMNKNMDNVFDHITVDNDSIRIQLNVPILEQEKIDDTISYISKSLNDFDKYDITIKNNNLEIIYP